MVRRPRGLGRGGPRHPHRPLHLLRDSHPAGRPRPVPRLADAGTRLSVPRVGRSPVAARRGGGRRTTRPQPPERARVCRCRWGGARDPRVARADYVATGVWPRPRLPVSVAARARRERSAQLRRLGRVDRHCVARRPQLLHREPRGRRRHLPTRPRHLRVDRRAGTRRGAGRGDGARTAPVGHRRLQLLLRTGAGLDWEQPARRDAVVRLEVSAGRQPGQRAPQLQLRVLQSGGILAPPRPHRRALACRAPRTRGPLPAVGAPARIGVLDLGVVRPGLRPLDRRLLRLVAVPDAPAPPAVRVGGGGACLGPRPVSCPAWRGARALRSGPPRSGRPRQLATRARRWPRIRADAAGGVARRAGPYR